MPDNHRENDGEILAERIRQEVSERFVCEINQTDLSTIWEGNESLPYTEKQNAIHDFADRHKLFVIIDYGLNYAVFRASNDAGFMKR